MKITVEFNSTMEVQEFAEKWLGDGGKSKNQGVKASDPIPYGRQIAEHFPEANVGTAPASPEPKPAEQIKPVSPSVVPVIAAPQPVVQTMAPTYKLDDLASAAMQLMDKGMQDQLQQLLAGYGVESLPSLPVEQYGNFATALRGMGAQI